MINIKVKRLTETAKIPTKAHNTDACYDLYVDGEPAAYTVIKPHEAITFNTGISTEIPEGYFAAVFARSGLGIKHNLRPSNCVGIIDADYRGEWKVALYNDSNEYRTIGVGERVAQFAILPVLETTLEEVNELTETERGEGGFGSTGK